jgi:hypothetical protein
MDTEPNREAKSEAGKSEKRPWTGECKPDTLWLKRPITKPGAVTKHFCEGCAKESEIDGLMLDLMFEQLGRDWHQIDWSENFLTSNACPSCIENSPVKAVAFALGTLPK